MKLSAVIRAAILEAVREAHTPWMDREGAAAYARVSTKTIHRWVKRGVLTEYFPPESTHPRFRRDDLDRLMEPAVSHIKLK